MADFTSEYSTGKLVDLQKKLEPGQLTADEHGSTQINHKNSYKLTNKTLFIAVDLSGVHQCLSGVF
jgi:LmbE family N-acetylglucosaminyl deacetylase